MHDTLSIDADSAVQAVRLYNRSIYTKKRRLNIDIDREGFAFSVVGFLTSSNS